MLLGAWNWCYFHRGTQLLKVGFRAGWPAGDSSMTSILQTCSSFQRILESSPPKKHGRFLHCNTFHTFIRVYLSDLHLYRHLVWLPFIYCEAYYAFWPSLTLLFFPANYRGDKLGEKESYTNSGINILCLFLSCLWKRESDYEFNSIYPQGMPRFYQVVIVELVPFLLPDCLHLQLPRDDKHSLCHSLPSCTPAMHEGCTSLQLNLPLKDSILLQWWASPQNYIGYLNICHTLHQLGHLSISRYTDVFFTFIAQFCLENIHPSTNFWKLNIRKKSFDFTVQKFQNENALCKVPGVRVLGVLCNGASVPPGPTTARDWSQAPFS